LFALLLPAAASAQIALYYVSGGTPTAITGGYLDLGNLAAGDSMTYHFQARNMGTADIIVTKLAVTGDGYTFYGEPVYPFHLAGGASQDLYVSLSAGKGNTIYPGGLQVNSVSVTLYAMALLTPTLTNVAGCPAPASTGDVGAIDFGSVALGSTSTCTYSMRNLNFIAVSIPSIAVSGSPFTGPVGIRAPVTLLPGEAVNFTLTFGPTTARIYKGSLTVGVKTYPLTGTGFTPPLSTPLLDVESTALESGQQRKLTITLSKPAPSAASGNVTIGFTPDIPSVKTDPTIVFAAAGLTTLSYTVNQGDTQVLIEGKTSAVFQTGSTAGKIRFTMTSSIGFQSDPTATFAIPASKIFVDSATGTRRLGYLDATITGFDNTYTAGSMAFTFNDTSGGPIIGGSLSADFTSNFRDYFAASKIGSMFTATVSFPISGDASQIGSVDVQMSNSTSVTMQHVVFP
jgi:hypothetical protein